MLGHQQVTPAVAPAIHIHGQMRGEDGGSQCEVSRATMEMGYVSLAHIQNEMSKINFKSYITEKNE